MHFACSFQSVLSAVWLFILPLQKLAQIFDVLLLHSLPGSGLATQGIFFQLWGLFWSILTSIILMGFLLSTPTVRVENQSKRCHQHFDISSISIQVTRDGSKRCFSVKLVRLFYHWLRNENVFGSLGLLWLVARWNL